MVKAEILKALRSKSSYLSGTQLATRLGISRAALWKHLKKLRELGYRIEAAPRCGYKLLSSPDKLYSFEVISRLSTEIMGKEVYFNEALSSTQDVARQLAGKGASEGTLVLAEQQTAGRGRLGRSWLSPPGGLWFSLILRPKEFSLLLLPVVAGAALLLTFEEKLQVSASLKWPNDVLINNRKVAGILAEGERELDVVHFVILGVGININNPPPEELMYPATSLSKELGRQMNRAGLLAYFLQKFEELYLLLQEGRSEEIIQAIQPKLAFLPTEICLKQGTRELQGRIVGLQKDGGLVLRLPSGRKQTFYSGEITPI